MTDSAVACTVKSPVALQIGDVKSDTSRPGVYVIDVTFPQGQVVKVSHSKMAKIKCRKYQKCNYIYSALQSEENEQTVGTAWYKP